MVEKNGSNEQQAPKLTLTLVTPDKAFTIEGVGVLAAMNQGENDNQGAVGVLAGGDIDNRTAISILRKIIEIFGFESLMYAIAEAAEGNGIKVEGAKYEDQQPAT